MDSPAYRALWGVVVMTAAGTIDRMLDRQADTASKVAIVVVGARHVAESVVLSRRPRASTYAGVSAVGVVHGASLVAAMRWLPGRRPLLLAGVAEASAWSAADALTAIRRRGN